jgi:hypothetical protein
MKELSILQENLWLVRRDVLHNILIEFGIPMIWVWLIRMYSNESYNKIHLGKNLSDTFLGQNGVKQLNVLLPLLFNLALEYPVTKVQKEN